MGRSLIMKTYYRVMLLLFLSSSYTKTAYGAFVNQHRAWSSSSPSSLLSLASRSTPKINNKHVRHFSTFLKSSISASTETKNNELTPITLLSGFLGSGKTTTLKHLLENKVGVKVGVVINDVASVNIDSKLISSMGSGDTVELQNGCACCSLADELLTSIDNLMKDRELDAVVVELSGVADPENVRRNWESARVMGHPVTQNANVSRIVTLVDACTFGSDWMTFDTAADREGWIDPMDESAAALKVPELLAEQVEAADVLIVNKADLAGEEQVEVASQVARGLNEKAELFQVSFGTVSPKDILGPVSTPQPVPVEDDTPSSSHDHSHEHSHGHDDHSHSSSCSEPDRTDPTHDHSHDHTHSSSCADPECTDPTHDHSHNHNHSSTSTDNLGITSFVYKATRPFQMQRLVSLLNAWPVPIKTQLDFDQIREAAEDGIDVGGEEQKNPFVGVLRSKGFCWLAPSSWFSSANNDAWRHDTAMYWSHAGKHFGITTAGKWWDTITPSQMKSYFQNNIPEYMRILSEDFVSDEFGDRRQELVFIGVSLDEERIVNELNSCLLSDEELGIYRSQVRNFQERVTNVESLPSLFDYQNTDHVG